MSSPSSTYEDLIARLEKASGADRELDGDICLYLGWTCQKMKGDSRPYFRKPGETAYYMRTEPPRLTGSFDAAVTLVPEMYDWVADGSNPAIGRCGATLRSMETGKAHSGRAINSAIALCIASLKARALKDEAQTLAARFSSALEATPENYIP